MKGYKGSRTMKTECTINRRTISFIREIVLNSAQMTAVFEDNGYIAITCASVIQLQHEGIKNVINFADFEKYTLKKVVNNLRHPGGCIPEPDPGATAGATITTPSFVFGDKSQICLKA